MSAGRGGTERTVDQSALDLARVIAGIADAEHGSDVLVLEVGDVLGVTEYFVIVSASNRRLVRTLVDEIEVQTREHKGRSPLRSEGVRENQWVLVDYGDADPFLTEQLRPELLQGACEKAKIPLTLRRQPGYDHSYYFISTFMSDHLRWHAERLKG